MTNITGISGDMVRGFAKNRVLFVRDLQRERVLGINREDSITSIYKEGI